MHGQSWALLLAHPCSQGREANYDLIISAIERAIQYETTRKHAAAPNAEATAHGMDAEKSNDQPEKNESTMIGLFEEIAEFF